MHVHIIVTISFAVLAGISALRFPCYFTNWGQYRPGAGLFQPENIPPFLCTHGFYAFAKLSGNKILPYEWDDQDKGGNITQGLYYRFNKIKERNPSFKTILSLGGWTAGSSQFSLMVSSEANRAEFIKNAIEYLRKWKFDGIDVDWEYPAGRGSPPKDRHLFTVLLKEMRLAFYLESHIRNLPSLMLTAAIGAGSSAPTYYELDKIGQYLDFINLMTYDYHGAFDTNHKVGFNSPLTPEIRASVKNVTREGLPANKINLGIAAYGRSYTLADRSQHKPGSTFNSAGTAGKYTRTAGFLSYYEICHNIKYSGWTEVWSVENQATYAYHNDQWVGFDTVRSVKLKMDFIKEQNLGGAFLWSYDLDDFMNMCGQGSYPLANTVKREILRMYYL